MFESYRQIWGEKVLTKVEVIDVMKLDEKFLVTLKGSNELYPGTKLISATNVYQVEARETQSIYAYRNKIVGVWLAVKPTETVLELG